MSSSFDDGPRFEARGESIIWLLRLVREGVAARVACNARLNGVEEDLLGALATANRVMFAPELPDFPAGSGEDGESVMIDYVTTAAAAELLDRTPRRVRQLATVEGVLRYRRRGGRIEVALADVEHRREERA